MAIRRQPFDGWQAFGATFLKDDVDRATSPRQRVWPELELHDLAGRALATFDVIGHARRGSGPIRAGLVRCA
jgi:hypothetical protein